MMFKVHSLYNYSQSHDYVSGMDGKDGGGGRGEGAGERGEEGVGEREVD